TDHQRNTSNCAQQKRHDARGCRGGFSDFLLVAHREIVVAPRPDIMPVWEWRDNLFLSCFDLARVANLHVDVAQISSADHALHRARIRHDHDVILIDSLRAQALWCQHTGDRERDLLNPQNLANRVLVAVDLRRSRATNDTDFVRAAHVLRRKWRAVRQGPLANIKIICRFTVDTGKPILVPGGHLRGGNNFLTDFYDTGDFAPDRFRIFDL